MSASALHAGSPPRGQVLRQRRKIAVEFSSWSPWLGVVRRGTTAVHTSYLIPHTPYLIPQIPSGMAYAGPLSFHYRTPSQLTHSAEASRESKHVYGGGLDGYRAVPIDLKEHPIIVLDGLRVEVSPSRDALGRGRWAITSDERHSTATECRIKTVPQGTLTLRRFPWHSPCDVTRSWSNTSTPLRAATCGFLLVISISS